ncbi:MAG: OmpA family protein [Elusimicrobia bacterium]|nr:OmpA family protein [Elusimicrobiota bacterium]MDE2236495.1 OmpA family protein [Elusimicrobiota bacterium]MDE2424599.1 OmpA family protein [Elusimicrobiota bacterium]
MLARLLPLILAATAAAWGWGHGKVIYVGTKEKPGQPIGLRSPQEELALIIARIKRGELPRIQFRFDSDKLQLSSYPTLDAIADLMLNYPKAHMMVWAHTDNIGSEPYNLDLSLRRAKSVKAYLVQRGVPPPSIRYRGYGFSKPIATNATPEGRALNRRVEFHMTSRDWNAVY